MHTILLFDIEHFLETEQEIKYFINVLGTLAYTYNYY